MFIYNYIHFSNVFSTENKNFQIFYSSNFQISCFNNSVVEEAVKKALQEAGVVLHCGYTLSQWNDGDDVTEIQSASFIADEEQLKLECGVSNLYKHFTILITFSNIKSCMGVYSYLALVLVVNQINPNVTMTGCGYYLYF